jgi:hypothetical protein
MRIPQFNSWMVHGTSWKLLFLPEWNIMKNHGTFLDGDGKSMKILFFHG